MTENMFYKNNILFKIITKQCQKKITEYYVDLILKSFSGEQQHFFIRNIYF